MGVINVRIPVGSKQGIDLASFVELLKDAPPGTHFLGMEKYDSQPFQMLGSGEVWVVYDFKFKNKLFGYSRLEPELVTENMSISVKIRWKKAFKYDEQGWE